MNRQEKLDASEAFLTVLFGGGAVGVVAFGSTFPGWWVFSQAVVPLVGAAVLAGIRRINTGRRNGNGEPAAKQ